MVENQASNSPKSRFILGNILMIVFRTKANSQLERCFPLLNRPLNP